MKPTVTLIWVAVLARTWKGGCDLQLFSPMRGAGSVGNTISRWLHCIPSLWASEVETQSITGHNSLRKYITEQSTSRDKPHKQHYSGSEGWHKVEQEGRREETNFICSLFLHLTWCHKLEQMCCFQSHGWWCLCGKCKYRGVWKKNPGKHIHVCLLISHEYKQRFV